ncbi:MAG: rRNA (cytidine-2-O)-methyltransferase TlyA [Actinomycetota bacterium]|jgi:23S rRNA (cytidine1920-2'-O)/16S rRNA (cytidine1409-2'-O)-methyltransferase
MALRRLDAELVRRNLSKSREEAKSQIESGLVKVDGNIEKKPTRQVATHSAIVLIESSESFVSRGAYKLLGALEIFEPLGLTLVDKHVLDAGASTGGFTQVSLLRGAREVVAVDVGYGQIAWNLRTDDRVHVIERFNIRNLTATDLPCEIDAVVADLSFISLTKVLPAIKNAVRPAADFVLMVKPQFEVGKADIGDGVVKDPELRMAAVQKVCDHAIELGLSVVSVGASPLPGPAGNVEYFLWLKAGESARFSGELADEIKSVVLKGPQ